MGLRAHFPRGPEGGHGTHHGITSRGSQAATAQPTGQYLARGPAAAAAAQESVSSGAGPRCRLGPFLGGHGGPDGGDSDGDSDGGSDRDWEWGTGTDSDGRRWPGMPLRELIRSPPPPPPPPPRTGLAAGGARGGLAPGRGGVSPAQVTPPAGPAHSRPAGSIRLRLHGRDRGRVRRARRDGRRPRRSDPSRPRRVRVGQRPGPAGSPAPPRVLRCVCVCGGSALTPVPDSLSESARMPARGASPAAVVGSGPVSESRST